MEYRKLISFGKSSYVVSLPKSWVVQNKLKKGDLVYFEENGSNLSLSKRETNQESEERERIVFIDGKDLPLIEREIISAYILNCRKITLKGNEIKTKFKELQSAVQNLIALEILEQTPDSIIAKDFLSMDKVSIPELLRKMDTVTRTMILECCNIFNENTYQTINDRDKDVNRLYFLLYRAVQYNLENPTKAMKNHKLTPVDLMAEHLLAFYVEGIADETRRTARFACKVKFTPSAKKEFEQFLNKVNGYYLNSMKAVYTRDVPLALKISTQKKGFNTELDILEQRHGNAENIPVVISRLRRMISYIHNLGRILYTGGNYL